MSSLLHATSTASPTYHIEPVQITWDPLKLAQAAGTNGVLLDSGSGYGDLGRFSFFGCEPFLILSSFGSKLHIVHEGKKRVEQGNPIQVLARLVREQGVETVGTSDHSLYLPFRTGAAIGFVSYELGRFIEPFPRLTKDASGVPELHFCFYDALLAHDHHNNQTSVIVRNKPQAKKRLQATLDKIQETSLLVTPPSLLGEKDHYSWQSSFTYESYAAAVKRTQNYITAGEIYQVNLSQRLWSRCPMPPSQLYQRFRTASPSPFGAYIEGKDWAVLSLSPERFLRYWPYQRRIQTRPIKGTRPRGSTQKEDQEYRHQLLQSPKDSAEHVMIVDLERNDLGRVADFGTVQVRNFRCLETFPTVHHLTSTVEGRLRVDRQIDDLLEATFPGGSITGAPKVRAMQIIDELEPQLRGIYTGSIGYIAFDGSLDLNIAIRTLVLKDGWAAYSAGGAIVADSKVEEEYLETFHKSGPFLKALNLSFPQQFNTIQ